MGPITIVLQLMRTTFLKNLAKNSMNSLLKNRLGQKIVRKTTGSTFRGAALKGNLKKAKDVYKFVKSPTLKKTMGLIDFEKIIKGMEFTEKQLEVARKFGKGIKNLNKIKSYYKLAINLTNYTTNKVENKIVDLLFGGRDSKHFTKIADEYDLDDFEKRLLRFQKNKTDVKKFNQMMNDEGNIVNIKLGLHSSWLFWGIWSPLHPNYPWGNMTLKVKPWVSKSSKNPSLIYNYGPMFGSPAVNILDWAKMNEGRAGTQFWRQYKGVKQKRRRKKKE
ncbi:MAG: hypothetical protein ACRCUM_03950 [Mycoplasmoidaceae bacterium]